MAWNMLQDVQEYSELLQDPGIPIDQWGGPLLGNTGQTPRAGFWMVCNGESYENEIIFQGTLISGI